MASLIAYLRTSTDKKTQSGPDQCGYSFDAQLTSIRNYAATVKADLVAIYSEQMSGGNNCRPQLQQAFAHAKKLGSEVAVCCSKIDRLSRDAGFIIQLSKSGVPFTIAEMPNADYFQLSLLAVFAENTRTQIRTNVKSAMAAAKLRGQTFGTKNPVLSVQLMNIGARKAASTFRNDIKPVLSDIMNVGGVKTLTGIANALNARGIKSRTGKKFYPTTVKNILEASVTSNS